MTPVWLLPVVPFVVASATGGSFFAPLNELSPRLAHITLAFCVCMVIIGLSLAIMIFTIYLFRLLTHGIPEGPTVLSVFVPLGPCGQGGFSIIQIGEACRNLFPFEGSASLFLGSAETGRAVYALCVSLALTLWTLGMMWFIYSLLAMYTYIVTKKTRFPFRNPFFGMIFPNVRRISYSADLTLLTRSLLFTGRVREPDSCTL